MVNGKEAVNRGVLPSSSLPFPMQDAVFSILPSQRPVPMPRQWWSAARGGVARAATSDRAGRTLVVSGVLLRSTAWPDLVDSGARGRHVPGRPCKRPALCACA